MGSLKNVMRLLSEVTSDLPVESDFLSALRRSIEVDANKVVKPPSKSFKPSSMNCVRNMYFQLTGAEQDLSRMSYTLAGITNAGTDIHTRTQRYVANMRANGFDCDYVDVAKFVQSRGLDYLQIVSKSGNGMETKLYHKLLNMSFLCDGIIRYKGKYYILEIKTETSHKWQFRKDVDPKHYNQGIAYSLAFGIDDVIFLYINRDILDLKAFMFHVTDEMRQALADRMLDVTAHVEAGEVPPMPADAGPKFCQYCAYSKVCSEAGNG